MSTNTNLAPCKILTRFSKWLDDLGGKTRVSKILGVNQSTLHRWETGEQKLPKWAICYMAMSCENTELKRENRRLRK